MKLLLTSGGLVHGFKDEFLNLLPKKPEHVRVAFIPTAANPENDRWYLNRSKLRFAELGINMVSDVDIEKENKETLAPKIANADVVYVEGGNTFYLLKHARASGFDDLIKEFLERGGVYVGSSAGSIISGTTIEACGDQNIVGLKDLAGMGLVPFAVKPHVDGNSVGEVKVMAARLNCPLVALNDRQAVIVDGARTEIIGDGAKIFFGQVNL